LLPISSPRGPPAFFTVGQFRSKILEIQRQLNQQTSYSELPIQRHCDDRFRLWIEVLGVSQVKSSSDRKPHRSS
jgi:hypothetical protein